MLIRTLALFISLFLSTFCGNLQYLTDEEIPEYLSIEANTMRYRKAIRKFVETRLEQSYNQWRYHDTLLQLIDILDNNDNIQKEAEPWHTTTLYIGNNLSKLESPIYKNFKGGIPVDLKIATMVYIPKRIICSPVFPNYDQIENKYPHVTLFTGLYPAVESNSVLAAIFSIPEYKEMYFSGKLKEDSSVLNVEINNLEVTLFSGQKEVIEKVYIIKTPEFEVLGGVTKKNYKANH
jgi:hypothetical protein